MFVTITQCKRIIDRYLRNSGRGGFMTGTIQSMSPLIVMAGSKLTLTSDNSRISESCIGLRVNGAELRPSLKHGDGVLILCRPDSNSSIKYIILDRIQPYQPYREVTVTT